MNLNHAVPQAFDVERADVVLLRWRGEQWVEIERAMDLEMFPSMWWPRIKHAAGAGDKIELRITKGRNTRTETYLAIPEGTKMTTDGVVFGNGPDMLFCTEHQIPKAIRAGLMRRRAHG